MDRAHCKSKINKHIQVMCNDNEKTGNSQHIKNTTHLRGIMKHTLAILDTPDTGTNLKTRESYHMYTGKKLKLCT
jgi:hypothetical protein